MKTTATIILMCFGVLLCHGQSQLKLIIKEGSDAPNYETEHVYLMELFNPGTQVSTVNISTTNKACSNVNISQQIDFEQVSMEKNMQNKIQQVVVQPGKTAEFYVKLSRSKDARLNTWNCTEVVAVSNDGRKLSNAIIIESLVPNRNNNN